MSQIESGRGIGVSELIGSKKLAAVVNALKSSVNARTLAVFASFAANGACTADPVELKNNPCESDIVLEDCDDDIRLDALDTDGGDTALDSDTGSDTSVLDTSDTVDTGETGETAETAGTDSDSDTQVVDTSIVDTSVVDTGTTDTEIVDTNSDTEVVETGTVDSGVSDTGIVDTGVVDTSITDTEVVETGTSDTNTETSVVDTEVIDTTVTDTGTADSDGDGLTDEEELNVYFTDPNDQDSDGDNFRDDFEITEGKDPNDVASTPLLDLKVMAYEAIVAYQNSGDVYTSARTDFTGSQDLYADSVNPVYIETEMKGTGAFAISYNPEQYLGSVDVYDCGHNTDMWEPTSEMTCTIQSPVEASALSDWSTISGSWALADFDQWYETSDSYSGYVYPIIKVELN